MDDEDPLVSVLSSGAGRSPVYRWLRQRRVRIWAAINQVGGRPNWTALAALMAEKGVVDGHGKPPTATTVRAQWRQVQIDVGFDKFRTDQPAPALDPIPPAYGPTVLPASYPAGRVEPPMPQIVDAEDEPFFAGGPKTNKGGK